MADVTHVEAQDAPEETTTEPATAEPAGEESTPPWERDGEEFDAARAWALIENLRREKAQLSEKLRNTPEPTPEVAPEPKRGPESTPEPSPDLTALQTENTKLKALAAAGLPLDLAPAVAGTTPEAIAANIQVLQSSLPAAPAREVPPNPAQAADAEPAVDSRLAWFQALRGK